MLSHRKRLGASILLTFLSIVAIILLLPTDKLNQLQKITLIPSSDKLADLWEWGSVDEDYDDADDAWIENAGDGIRLVVFGDSWVDDVVEGDLDGRGKSWPQVLCEEINCTSRLSFSASQPPSVYLEHLPTGVYTSHTVHNWAQSKTPFLPLESAPAEPLPDLVTQVQKFISLPVPTLPPTETIFVFSFGFWDVYDFARLDFEVAKNATDDCITEFFSQLDILYDHFKRNLYPAVPKHNITSRKLQDLDTSKAPQELQFKIILPKLFDPTLAPGWITLRPAPVKPSSVAEQQKNAVYLTKRWNQQLENGMGKWLQAPILTDRSEEPSAVEKAASTSSTEAESENPIPTADSKSESDTVTPISEPISALEGTTITPNLETKSEAPKPESKPKEETLAPKPDLPKPKLNNPALKPDSSKLNKPASTHHSKPKSKGKHRFVEKDVFYYDIEKALLDLIVEHQMEDESIVDANGLGAGESPFESVVVPCLHTLEEGEDINSMKDVNGLLLCKQPDDFLWWDSWNVGGVANNLIGKGIAEKFAAGRGLRSHLGAAIAD